MDFFAKLKERALSLFSKPGGVFTDATKHDAYDERFFQELIDEVPALRKLATDLGIANDYSEDLVRDVLMQFWKAAPTLRDAKAMDPRYLHNHAATADVVAAPDTARLQSLTRHDRYGAAMATLSVAERIASFLQNNAEAREKQEAAAKAQQAAQAAREQAQAAMDAATEGDGGAGGEGSGTAGEIEALLDALEQAQAEADEAQQAVVQALTIPAAAAQTDISMAIKQAAETLEEEANLFHAWGIGPGELKRMPFEERRRLAYRLRSNRLARFAKLIGRRRIAAAAMRTKRTEYGRDEVVDVELSNDPERVLESEWMLSRVPALRMDFLARFADGELLSKKFQGNEKVRQGAIIGLCDNSGSMSNTVDGVTKEAWAKGTMLALLDQARAENRDFVWINFSDETQIKMWEFPAGKAPLTDLLAAVEEFYRGGTHYETPIDWAISAIQRNPQKKADIVLITDDEYALKPEWTKEYLATKGQLGFRMFGFGMGFDVAPDGALAAISDYTQSIKQYNNPNDIANLIKVL